MDEDTFKERLRAVVGDNADRLADQDIIQMLARLIVARRLALEAEASSGATLIEAYVFETATIFALANHCAGYESWKPLEDFLASMRADA